MVARRMSPLCVCLLGWDRYHNLPILPIPILLNCFDTDTSSYLEHGRILGNLAAIKLSGPVCNLTPAVWKERWSVGMMRGKGRGGERGLLLPVSPHSNGRYLTHRSDRHTQLDRESCSAGGRYSPRLFPCLLVYKRQCTSKSHSIAGAVRWQWLWCALSKQRTIVFITQTWRVRYRCWYRSIIADTDSEPIPAVSADTSTRCQYRSHITLCACVCHTTVLYQNG